MTAGDSRDRDIDVPIAEPERPSIPRQTPVTERDVQGGRQRRVFLGVGRRDNGGERRD